MAHHHEHDHTCRCSCHEHEHHHDHEHSCECSCHEHTHAHDACGCGHDHAHGDHTRWLLLASALLWGASWLPIPLSWWTAAACALAVLPLGIAVVRAAFGEWRDRRVGENTLLLLAVPSALAIGEYREGALVLILFTLGEMLEEIASDRSRREVQALAAIRPEEAVRLLPDGTTENIRADAIAVGDILQIPPHSRIAADGVVLSGASALDTAALTGESVPRPATAGDEVLSGFVNLDGMLTMRATAPAAQSAAARIVDMVSDAAAQKSRAQRFITRFANWYTPLILVAALLVTLLPTLLGQDFVTWLYRGLAFLVAGCPCALVISVPLSIFVGIGAASKQGILLKGGRYVEALAAVKGVALDKTGTLTTEQFIVTDRTWHIDETTAKGLLAALEAHSAHPLASALRAEAADTPPLPLCDLQEQAGFGVVAKWDGKTVLCGNRRMLNAHGITPITANATLWLAVDGKEAAAFTLENICRSEAADALAQLKALGVTKVCMLTGDSAAAAAPVAAQLDIADVHADLLPADKQTALQAFRAKAGTTLLVGDGINDAPVLALADVGVAMGQSAAAAWEAADAVLMADRLTQLPQSIRLCRRIMRTVRVNVAFALLMKAAVLVAALFGFAPLWLAVFADVGVTLLTVLHALTLLKAAGKS